MAYANIDERRAAVRAAADENGKLTTEQRKRIQAQFGCSAGAIYYDIVDMLHGHKPGTTHVTKSLRRRVIERYGNVCQYCGSHCRPIIDHIKPQMQGGKATDDNLIIACDSCNCKLGGKTEEYKRSILISRGVIPTHRTVAARTELLSDAHNAGINAYTNGLTRIAVEDPNMIALLARAGSEWRKITLNAWYAGWEEARSVK